MKTINAYFKIKLFLKRIEIIETSIRTSAFPEKLKSSKDYFVSLEGLKISTSLKTLALCFKEEALKRDQGMYSMVFIFWSKKMTEKAEKIDALSFYLDTLKEEIKKTIIKYNKFFNESNSDKEERTCSVIEGVQFSIEDDFCLRMAISIFEIFILSTFNERELTPSIEFEELFLN